MSYAGFLIAVLVACFLVFANLKPFFKESKNVVVPLTQEAAGGQETSDSIYFSQSKDVQSRLNASSQKEIDRVKEMESLR